MHLSMESNNNNPETLAESHVTEDPPIIDFSLPITTTYLNHMRGKRGGYGGDDTGSNYTPYSREREVGYL